MHKYLNKFGLAGIGMALVMTPAMIAAQDTTAEAMPPETTQETAAPATALTPDQEAMMQTWPQDKQAAFKAWPAETQSYFFSLTDERQQMFWALSDSDKVTLSQMAEAQRESVWAQIESRAGTAQS
jgi:hypothetical protein